MAASGNGQIAAGAAGLLNQGEVRLGLAFNEDSSDLAAGISAVRFNDDGDKDDMDIGLLFGAKKTVTYGLTVYDVFGRHSRGLRKFAFGVAGDQSSSITFLADFLSYINSNDGNKFYGYFTPGIRLLFDRFHLSFSSRMYTGPSDYEQAALKPKSLTLLGIGYVFNSGDSLQIMNNYLGDIGIAYNMNFQKEYE